MLASARRRAPAYALALAAAGPAMADLTPADVWADWQASAADFGQTLSVGAEQTSGDTLTLSDVSVTMDLDGGAMNGTIAEVVMTANGDGTVTIAMSPEFPFDLTIDPEEGDGADLSLVFTQPDLDLVASGDPGAISYAYSAPAMTVTMTGTAEGDGPSELDMTMVLSDLAGVYDVTDGDPRQVASAISIGAVGMDMTGSDPGSDDSFKMTLTMADIASESSGNFSALGSMTNLSDMIEAGLSTQSTSTFGAGGYVIEAVADGSEFTMDAQSTSGTLEVSIGPDGLVYGAANEGVTLAFSGSEIPVPDVGLAIERTGGRIAMPLAVTEEPQDVALNISLVGLTASDMIWSMFDPAGALSRDPATLIIDLLAKANWDIDVFDPDVVENGIDAPPGKLHALNVNELRLSLAGAELTGSGDLEFNNDAPMPMPAGTINLMLTGGNALLDTLVEMGLVPQDQAMGARMMLGLFARPGDGEDTLVSEITFQEDGAILANGQRIR